MVPNLYHELSYNPLKDAFPDILNYGHLNWEAPERTLSPLSSTQKKLLYCLTSPQSWNSMAMWEACMQFFSHMAPEMAKKSFSLEIKD